MGYYTSYRLTIIGNEDIVHHHPCPNCNGSGRIDMSAYEMVVAENENLSYEMLEEPQKWYTYAEDMIAISEKFPELVFQLNGEGEEPGDIWVKYYKNGKTQESKIYAKLADFDESKLK